MTLDLSSDRAFDLIFSKEARKLARIHWTPVEVALRAAAFLTAGRADARVLDVGAGVGKFCLIGAAATRGHFTGVEMVAALVAEAKALAKAHKVDRVRFIAGDAFGLDWAEFDGVYLFNPFAEAIAVGKNSVTTRGTEREAYVGSFSAARARMEAMPPGARVATYFGYGGNPPSGFRLEAAEKLGTGLLALWVKD